MFFSSLFWGLGENDFCSFVCKGRNKKAFLQTSGDENVKRRRVKMEKGRAERSARPESMENVSRHR